MWIIKKRILNFGIYNNENEQYIHIDDLLTIFKDSIYHDKISGKIIITTYDRVKKIDKTDGTYTVKNNENIFFSLNKVMLELGKEIAVFDDKIHVFDGNYIEAKVKNNKTELYDKQSGEVVCFFNKEDDIRILINQDISQTDVKIVDVFCVNGSNSYVGCVLKDNLDYEYVSKENVEEKGKIVLVKADKKIMPNTNTDVIDIVAMDMYRLSGVKTLTKLDSESNIPKDVKLFATVNNGQSSSNYDPDITTGMLNSEMNREDIIHQLVDNIQKLDGICVNFGNLKTSDKQQFMQFIKELAAVLHANKKSIIVNVSNIQYIDIKKVSQVVDYIVIQPYFARTISSKTSGPISAINYVENTIKDIINKQVESSKIILEIPCFSILWTERKGTVINAERYNMHTALDYMNANKIDASIDKVSGQNYINYTKGITTYKMWLEDEYSVSQKTKLAVKYNLAGVSIYKSGMELKKIYNGIATILKNS